MFTFGATRIRRLALSLVLGVAVVTAEPIIALTGPGSDVLIRFDSASPGTAIPVPITGLLPGDNLIGIDIRPSNRLLYGLAFENRLYTIDPLTGIATLAASLSPDPSDSSDPFSSLFGIGFGVDFNPVADFLGLPSLRVISPNQSLRVNANNGSTITDINIPPPSFINAAAYANNDALPSTSTTLYGFNRTDGTLVRSTNPNMGTYVTQGSLGIDVDSSNGFDISGTGIAYAALTPQFGGEYELYTIDLSTGAATSLGAFDQSYDIRGIAAQPLAPIPEPSTFLLMFIALLGIVVAARKGGWGVSTRQSGP